MRLNKFIARSGFSSRRKAEELITAGKVKVNHQVVKEPYFQVKPEQDQVYVNDQKIHLQTRHCHIVLNKPIEVVTTLKDPQQRKTVYDLLPASIKKQRPFPVGRLDYFSEGLLLLTTDGELCYRLTHPRYKVKKVYQVTVKGKQIRTKLRVMEQGMILQEGDRVLPAQINILEHKEDLTVFEITIKQGLNRQIRRMCRDLELTILKLKRIQMGNIRLLNTKPGQYRFLSSKEIKCLYTSLGLR
ncbi:MAG: pseudouridine synthase [Desulfonauticus sp.]|nr:pseudouridine synthase [Desulfonauticus sp.]